MNCNVALADRDVLTAPCHIRRDRSPSDFSNGNATQRRRTAIESLALELAELTLSPNGLPDQEDWELAELLFQSGAE